MTFFELLLFHFYQTGSQIFPAFSPYGRELSISMHIAHTGSSFFSLFSAAYSLSLIPSCLGLGLVVEQQKRKGNKVCTSFELSPLIWKQSCAAIMLVHVWLLQRLRWLIVLNNITVWHDWLTNAQAFTSFDRDSSQRARRLFTTRLLWFRCGRLVVAARVFWWQSVSRLVRLLFWSRLSESGELMQTQLARVEMLGVQKELKDMDLCQRISYIAHILQAQLRIRDRRPWPCSAHPTICPPGAGGYETASVLPGVTACPQSTPRVRTYSAALHDIIDMSSLM